MYKFVAFFLHPATFAQIFISPQPDKLRDLCPGEEINITCETRGSTIIAWTSNEYIEQGGTQLEFATFNTVGEVRISPVNPNTVATLINKTTEGGRQVLRSQLHIIASADSIVTCINVGGGTTNAISIRLLGKQQSRIYGKL